LTEERLDYAILISLSMREEAEVMASALRAEGIDSFVGNRHHANYNWGQIIALGGLQVFVPRLKIDEAKDVIRTRIKEAAEHPEGEAMGRRDRWKAWAVILGTIGLNAYFYWFVHQELPEFSYAPAEIEAEPPGYFAAPAYLSEGEQITVLRHYCGDHPDRTVISREGGMGYITPCADILPMQ
jgi:hypothetical protein